MSSFKADSLRVGFIGAGRMAQALSKGFITAGLVKPENIIASDVFDGMLKVIQEFGVKTTKSNKEVAQSSDVIFIAVKPDIVTQALQDISSVLTKQHLVVSIAAGITLKTIEMLIPRIRVIRVMPNTPALVNAGASVFCLGTVAGEADGKLVSSLLRSIGTCDPVPEMKIDAVTGLSGGGPAYCAIAIESLADGGVRMGLPRDLAMRLAAQTMLGTAKMMLDTRKHPAELKDAVCSPGGTTIAGVQQLEKGAFRASLINAVEAATNRSKELSKI